ncbi:MAG: SDR family oxidoreductase [Desulfofustis sp.]|nr:SDR family oxidoreductase [Desulfofustis sp.]
MNKTTDLSGRTVLVAGASRPVGRAIADQFGRRGASLILPVHSDWPESTAEMRRQFDMRGYHYICIPCDLTLSHEVRELANQAERTFDHVDYLINNIERGGMPIVHGPYDRRVNRQQWDLEFDVTVRAKWNLYTHTAELMQRSTGGAVINVSSMAAEAGRSGPASLLFSDGYSAASRAVASFTRQWAREAAPKVRVNEVMLGLCAGRHGENTRGWTSMTDSQRQALVEHTLLKRTSDPEEVAELVYFLAVRATYMTGAVVLHDGGYLLGGEGIPPLPAGVLDEP